MEQEIPGSDVYFSYPTALEIKAAQAACCGKCCLSCEAPAAYAWRRRDIDMAALLKQAIERELSGIEREAVEMHWFEGLSIAEISRRQGKNPSVVSRTLERAKKKLHSVLRYAVEYQRSVSSETVTGLALRRAAAIAAAREGRFYSFGARLRAFRTAQNISRSSLAQGIGIGEARLLLLEQGKTQPSAQEVVEISAYFDTTTDSLLRGD